MKSILIVEDNTELQELYREGLATRGFTDVTFVDTAAKGIAALTARPADLVLLDIMLPQGSNGFDMLEQMKKDSKFTHVPVVIVTNLDSQEKSARDIGVLDYIVKANKSFDDILNKIVSYLEPAATGTPSQPAPQA